MRSTESSSLGLTLLTNGDLLLDGQRTTPEQLRAAIQKAKAETSEVVCLIAADKAVAHGRVVWLIDLVKSEGVAKFAINIDKSEMIASDPALLDQGVGVLPGN